MKIEVRVGDYVKCFNRENYYEVLTIEDGALVLSNERRVPADDDVVEDLKSFVEYEKFASNFELEDGI